MRVASANESLGSSPTTISVKSCEGRRPEASSADLVSEGTVDEPVGNDPFAGFERGLNGLLDMVRARRGEQQGLRLRSPAVLIAAQQQLTDRFGAAAPAGLASD